MIKERKSIDDDRLIGKNYFGGNIHYDQSEIHFAFQYPKSFHCRKVGEKPIANDLSGLLREFKDLEECPTLEEAYYRIFKYLNITRSEIPFFQIQILNQKKEVQEAICIEAGKFKSFTTTDVYRKIVVNDFGESWEFLNHSGNAIYCYCENGLATFFYQIQSYYCGQKIPTELSLLHSVHEEEYQMVKKLTKEDFS